MRNGLYVIDFHAHLQDGLMQEVLCKEERGKPFFKHAIPLLEQIAHYSEPVYSELSRALAAETHDRFSALYRTMGPVLLMEVLRLFKKYGVDLLLQSMDLHGIDHAVILSLEPLTRTQNIIELIKPHRDRLSVFASVHRNEPDPVGYFKSFVESGAVSGLKIHPIVGGFACGELYDKVKDVVAYVAEQRMPVLIHTGHIPIEGVQGLTGCCEIDALEPLIADFPKAKFILGHTGWESWRRALALGQRYPNVFVETSWQKARKGDIRHRLSSLQSEICDQAA